jgi:hypothetical protein
MAFRSSSDSFGWEAMAPSKLPAITFVIVTLEMSDTLRASFFIRISFQWFAHLNDLNWGENVVIFLPIEKKQVQLCLF